MAEEDTAAFQRKYRVGGEESKGFEIMPLRGDDRELWEQQPGETGQQFGRFQHYLEQGPYANRSFNETARYFGVSKTLIRTVSRRWSWKARAEAWDAFCARVRRQDDLRDAVEMRRAQREAGRRMRVLGMQELEKLFHKVERGKELSPNEIRLLIDAGFKHEAAAVGQVDAPTEVQHKFKDIDVTQLTEEQLRRLVVDGEDPAKVLQEELGSQDTLH